MHEAQELRIIELECRSSLQEDLLQAMQAQLNLMERLVADLQQRVQQQHEWLKGMQTSPVAAAHEEVPPPHY